MNLGTKWKTKELRMIGNELRLVVISHKIEKVYKKQPNWWIKLNYFMAR